MTRALDYARPTPRRPSRPLALAAHLALAYPLLLVGCLYGEWLLAWLILGREPQPGLDDPKFISGSSWIHPVTGLAIVCFVPAACAAVVLNTLYAIDSRLQGRRLAARVVLLTALWLGTIALLHQDPHRVLGWWFD